MDGAVKNVYEKAVKPGLDRRTCTARVSDAGQRVRLEAHITSCTQLSRWQQGFVHAEP